MRFEIKGGGIFAILLSLAVLSGAVFFCGLLAGYDVGRQSQSATAVVATSYSIPSAPLAAASPPPAVVSAPVATPAAIAANENPPPAASDDSEAPPPAKPEAKPSSVAGHVIGEVPAAQPSPAAAEHTETASVDEGHGSATGDSGTMPDEEAPPPPPPKHHAFNVQIQAVMDMSGANQMIRRLERIGYPAHMVATPIDGQTWYKVEVGPYPTQEEAAAAQVSMRQKYNDTYGGGHAASAGASSPPAGGGAGTANNDE